jgi:hypothetical protein
MVRLSYLSCLLNACRRISKHAAALVMRRYGYLYQCARVVSNICFIRPEPFRGAPCSDAAGREIDYAEVVRCEHAIVVWLLNDGDAAAGYG